MIDAVETKVNVELVKKQACFQKLSEKEIAILAELFVEQTYAANEVIVKEGSPVDSIFLIVSGIADVRKEHVNAASESVAQLKEGDSIGLNDTGFYSLTGLRTATVVALTDMKVLHLSVALFHGFALNYPHVHEVMQEQAGAYIKMGA